MLKLNLTANYIISIINLIIDEAISVNKKWFTDKRIRRV